MFFVPRRTVSEHGIEDGDHLSHAGGQRHFLVFATGDQALVSRPAVMRRVPKD